MNAFDRPVPTLAQQTAMAAESYLYDYTARWVAHLACGCEMKVMRDDGKHLDCRRHNEQEVVSYSPYTPGSQVAESGETIMDYTYSVLQRAADHTRQSAAGLTESNLKDALLREARLFDSAAQSYAQEYGEQSHIVPAHLHDIIQQARRVLEEPGK